jgi:hypothetical protein
MFPIKVRLSSVGFAAELEEMKRHSQISLILADALNVLILREQSKRDHALTDLPLMSLDLQKAIIEETDGGRIMVDRECFQFLMVQSECVSKPLRLKIVRTECPLCFVAAIPM